MLWYETGFKGRTKQTVLSRRGVWTSELNEAFDFQYYAGKPDYADQLDNVGVELVIDAEYRKGATQCCVGSLS
jgi:hypothetical protein